MKRSVTRILAIAAICYVGESQAQEQCGPDQTLGGTMYSFGNGESMLKASADYRIAFVSGFVSGITSAEFLGAPRSCIIPLTSCFRGKSASQLAAIVEKFIREHPENWDYPAAVLAHNEFHDMCKKQGIELGKPSN